MYTHFTHEMCIHDYQDQECGLWIMAGSTYIYDEGKMYVTGSVFMMINKKIRGLANVRYVRGWVLMMEKGTHTYLADVLLHQLGTRHADEGTIGVMCHGTS